ncbi:hypothetical protein C8R43DRAFT_953760 [Mycena crocata]|nr:hypothetical protein C8R43DRAFT_953760 [Mycena crocata]
MATGTKRAATSSPEDLQGSSPLSPPPPETPTPLGRNAPSSPPSPLAGKRGKSRALNAGTTGGIIDTSFDISGAPTLSTSEPSLKDGLVTVRRERVTKRTKSSRSSVLFAENTEDVPTRDSDDVFDEPHVRANVPASDEDEDTSDPGENSSDYDPRNEPQTRVNPKTKKKPSKTTAESKKVAKVPVLGATPKKRIDAKKSSVATNTRKRVLIVDPNGGRCLLTFTSVPAEMIQYAHVIARRTESEQLTILEFEWGMEYWTLYIDTYRNMVPLKADFHLSMDAHHWMLVPHHTAITLIQEWINAQRRTGGERAPITNLYTTGKRFQYYVCPLTPDIEQVAIQRHKEGQEPNATFGPNALENHFHPFSTLDALTSHINPHFVIYSAGQKLETQQRNLGRAKFAVWLNRLAQITSFGHIGNAADVGAANLGSLELLLRIYIRWSSPARLPKKEDPWFVRPQAAAAKSCSVPAKA